MFVKSGILFAQNFVMQTHRYLWKWHPNCAILEQKLNSCLAIMVKMWHGHGFSLLPNCFKVQINSLARFMEPGRGIPHVIVIPWHPFLSSGHPDLAENDTFLAHLCPDNQCVWVQTTAEAVQSHNRLMINVREALNAIYTEVSCANTPLLFKMAPKLPNLEQRMSTCIYMGIMVKIWHGHGFSLLPNMVISFNLFMSNLYRTWEGHSTCLSYPMTPVSLQLTPKFGRECQFSCPFVPK